MRVGHMCGRCWGELSGVVHRCRMLRRISSRSAFVRLRRPTRLDDSLRDYTAHGLRAAEKNGSSLQALYLDSRQRSGSLAKPSWTHLVHTVRKVAEGPRYLGFRPVLSCTGLLAL